MGQAYHEQIRNEPAKNFDPAKEFTEEKLMETEVSQKSEICENSYGDDVFFPSKMICANDPGEFTVITEYDGVISYGRSCDSYSSPGVYTRLSAFLEWIALHTVENSRFCPN